MHTEFIILGKRFVGAENTVASGYLTSFRTGGRVFDGLTVFFNANGISQSVTLPTEHVSTNYLGDGKACFCFRYVFPDKGEATVTSVAFKGQDGTLINSATVSDLTLDGEAVILANAYVRAYGGVELLDNAEGLFECIFGVREHALTAFVRGADTFYGGTEAAVKAEWVEGDYVLSAEIPSGATGENLVFFCDKAPVLSVAADLSRAGTVGVTPVNRVLAVKDGLEITEKAGSAISSSEITVHTVGKGGGGTAALTVPFSPTGGTSSPYEGILAVKHGGGVTLVKRSGGKPVCAHPFNKPFMSRDIRSFCATETEVLLLSDKLERVDASTGELIASYPLQGSYTEVFGFENTVILCDKQGFCVFEAGDGLTQAQGVTLSGARYAFDCPSKTLTAVTAGNIRQYIFSGTSFTECAYAVSLAGLSSAVSVGGRLGRAVLTYENRAVYYGLLDGLRQTVEFKGATCVQTDGSGVYLSVFYGNRTEVYVFTADGYSLIGELTGTEPAVATALGVVQGGKIYPYTAEEKLFEVVSETVGSNYTAYTQSAYFSSDSVVLNFEAII